MTKSRQLTYLPPYLICLTFLIVKPLEIYFVGGGNGGWVVGKRLEGREEGREGDLW